MSDTFFQSGIGGTPGASFNTVLSASSGGVSTSSTGYSDISNLSCTITTSGNSPVLIVAVPDGNSVGSGNESSWSLALSSGSATGYVNCDMGGSSVGQSQFQYIATATTVQFPPSVVSFYDFRVAGTYTYKLQFKVASGTQTFSSNNIKLLVYEI